MKAVLSRRLPSAAWVLMLGALYCGSGSGKPPAASDGTSGGAARAPVRAPRDIHHTSENWVGPPLPKARVILTDVYGGRHAVDVEVAATDPMRERGMMW
ncbi:MAG TPA: hypothetical protein VE549_02450, partial [Myxococcaceae bacterium]|nr:hypothetical protein [Myxococcaceae bacterium]